MWPVIPCLEAVLQSLAVCFTEPSFATHREVLLGWVLCLGRRTEFRVFEASMGKQVRHDRRHPFDRFYNFFSRSSWTVSDLARQVAVKLVLELNLKGELLLVVDATLLHKKGKNVWNIGWFHDPVASTKKRAVTATGNKWVVIGLGVRIPGTQKIFCLPIHAQMVTPGKKKGEASIAKKMLQDILTWFPDRKFVLCGDGGYSANTLLKDLDPRVHYVGMMRIDAAINAPNVPKKPKGKPGPRAHYGKRLPSPQELFKKIDRTQSKKSPWKWRTVKVLAYGQLRTFKVCSFEATWPKVLGLRPIKVVLSRSKEKGFGDVCYFTTDLNATAEQVLETYAKRISIEATFKSSKEVFDIQRPRHWCKQSIEKLAPWVWLTQSVIALWYIKHGRKLPEAKAARKKLGPWDTEWSFQHIMRILRRLTIRQAIISRSSKKADMQQLIDDLENYLFTAA